MGSINLSVVQTGCKHCVCDGLVGMSLAAETREPAGGRLRAGNEPLRHAIHSAQLVSIRVGHPGEQENRRGRTKAQPVMRFGRGSWANLMPRGGARSGALGRAAISGPCCPLH
jgi:hypothetical protein